MRRRDSLELMEFGGLDGDENEKRSETSRVEMRKRKEMEDLAFWR